jgi:hypothetical protein
MNNINKFGIFQIGDNKYYSITNKAGTQRLKRAACMNLSIICHMLL